MWFRLAIKEILNHPKFTLLFVFNLALGLASFVLIDAFKLMVSHEMSQGSRTLLGADVAISCNNRPCSEEELAQIKNFAKSEIKLAHSTSLFSMLAHRETSKLAQLIAIDERFPLYGKFTLEDGGEKSAGEHQELHEADHIWLFPELAVHLHAKKGDRIKVGDRFFTVADIVKHDPTNSLSAFNFVARAYISSHHLKDTNLMRPGSRYTETYFMRFPPDSDESKLSEELKVLLPAKDIKITSHRRASENLTRALNYLTDYLGLIALVALFLSAFGSAFLFRSFISSRAKDIAILKSLGAQTNQAIMVFCFQILILGFLAALTGVVTARLLLPLIPELVATLLPIPIQPTLHVEAVVMAFVIGGLGSLLICLPLLRGLGSVKPLALLHERSEVWNVSWRNYLWYIPGTIMFWLLAMAESRSVLVGSLFVGSLLVAIALFTVSSWFLLSLLSHPPKFVGLSGRLGLRNLSRQRFSSAACFLAIGCGAMLLSLVPQIHDFVSEEIASPKGFVLPSLFLVDIQEEQLNPLTTLLHQKNIELQYTSPMVRARLIGINDDRQNQTEKDEGANESQGEQNERWARTRGQNLSYRARTFPSERIIEGREFRGSYTAKDSELPEISIEMRYAQRLGVDIGDTLDFDVQGVEIKGRIVNIRRVRWTSFQPNFFIVFQPGVLEDAPKIYLASVPPLAEEKRFGLQSEIVSAFPNITIVDVPGAIQRILSIVQTMGWVVRFMAYFALVAGMLVLYSIANHQAFMRRWDINLFKVLGARFADVRRMVVIEFAALALTASTLGLLLSLVMSYAISRLVFSSPWTPGLATLWWPPLVITTLSIITALIATHRVLREKPLQLLNDT